jgi:VIT1/CCC1 family predicted Fe2+/Mn2+ transporter
MVDIRKFSLGTTAAITTSMGLIAGLAEGSGAKISIITGLLIIAIADNIVDSLGIHIYKESEGASRKDVVLSTYGNFVVRLFLTSTFILIVLLFSSTAALITSFIWGLILLSILSYLIAKHRGTNPVREIIWHLMVALLVVAGSKLLGNLILSKMNLK